MNLLPQTAPPTKLQVSDTTVRVYKGTGPTFRSSGRLPSSVDDGRISPKAMSKCFLSNTRGDEPGFGVDERECVGSVREGEGESVWFALDSPSDSVSAAVGERTGIFDVSVECKGRSEVSDSFPGAKSHRICGPGSDAIDALECCGIGSASREASEGSIGSMTFSCSARPPFDGAAEMVGCSVSFPKDDLSQGTWNASLTADSAADTHRSGMDGQKSPK